MERQIGDVTIECVQGNVAAQPGFDAVVNAANAFLTTGGGVAGAIHRAAGPGLAAECRPLAPIEPGQAVITSGHRLPNRFVIHCLGPVYGRDIPSDEILARCYRNALRLAEANGVTSIAFPAISTGVFGYPLAEAADVAVRELAAAAPGMKTVRRIRIVLFDEDDLRIWEARLAV
jgi:O-acetyl-ADP-ribose deacetylase (regulator of RNase III)